MSKGLLLVVFALSFVMGCAKDRNLEAAKPSRVKTLTEQQTTKPAEKLIGLFSTLYAGAGLPDFLVYDKSVLKYGWGSIKAAGFFDKDWKFDKELSYVEN